MSIIVSNSKYLDKYVQYILHKQLKNRPIYIHILPRPFCCCFFLLCFFLKTFLYSFVKSRPRRPSIFLVNPLFSRVLWSKFNLKYPLSFRFFRLNAFPKEINRFSSISSHFKILNAHSGPTIPRDHDLNKP